MGFDQGEQIDCGAAESVKGIDLCDLETPLDATARAQWKRERRRRRLCRGVAGLLTTVMCVEALLGNGVSTAIAESITSNSEWQQTVSAVSEANGGGECLRFRFRR